MSRFLFGIMFILGALVFFNPAIDPSRLARRPSAFASNDMATALVQNSAV